MMRAQICLSAVTVLFADAADAQVPPPALLRDIHTGPPTLPLGSHPYEWTTFGGRLWFVAGDAAAGRELHVSDGTAAGTGVFANITPGRDGSTWGLTPAGNRLYFSVGDDLRSGLWVTDGARAQPVLLIGNSPLESEPTSLTAVGSRVFFAAGDGVHGEELWTSDGTTAGTRMVTDLEPGWRGSRPRNLVALSSGLFFSADTNAHGREPWITDGTAVGTRLLSDTVPGHLNSDNVITVPDTVNGRVLFFSGGSLWGTDGTPSGTTLLRAGLDWDRSIVQKSAVLNRFVYLSARTTIAARGLWRSDGTPAGTSQFVDSGGSSTITVGTVNGRLVYLTSRLWSTDGTVAGTQRVTGAAVRSAHGAAAIGNRLLFTGVDNSIGVFWTDGLVAANLRGGFGAIGEMGIVYGGRAWFTADDRTGSGAEPWVTDGTPAGTMLFKDIARRPPGATASSDPRDVTAWGDRLAFLANATGTHSLWLSDGTTLGTVAGPAFAGTDPFGDDPSRLFQRADKLFALIDDPAGGRDLLLYADAGAGPRQLTAVPGGFGPFETVGYRDGVAIARTEVYVSDGTVAGTTRVTINPSGASYASEPTVVGSTLFVSAFDGTNSGLWRIDGTVATHVTPPLIYGNKFAAADGFLFFEMHDGIHGEEPWVSDGTPGGTHMLLEIHPGGLGSYPEVLCRLPGGLIFSAWDPIRGTELWATDGTTIGTFPLPEVVPGVDSPFFEGAVALAGRCLFVAGEVTRGQELWVLGPGGWHTIDLHPGAPSSSPRLLERVGDEVWFVADEPNTGRGLFRTDGTSTGTHLVAPLDSEPSLVELHNGRVWVDLDELQHGRELWSLDPGAVVEPIGHPCGDGLELPRLDSSDPVLGRTWTLEGGGGEAGLPGLVILGPRAPSASRVAGWCWSVVDLGRAIVVHSIADGSAPWSWSVPLPNDPALVGITVAAQTWHASNGGPAGLASSAGLRAVLGVW